MELKTGEEIRYLRSLKRFLTRCHRINVSAQSSVKLEARIIWGQLDGVWTPVPREGVRLLSISCNRASSLRSQAEELEAVKE
eukprot:2604873-Amphidinium_carterae.3